MVKKISIFFAYFFFFLFALMYFTPKQSIYYFAEQELRKYDVIVSDESVSDNGFSLELEHAGVSVKAIESANIKDITILLLGFYNSLNVEGVKLSSTASAFVPLNIQHINVHYSIFNPLNVKASAIGEFGDAEANFSLVDMALHIDVKPSKMMLTQYKNTLNNLKKSKEGRYVYDQNF